MTSSTPSSHAFQRQGDLHNYPMTPTRQAVQWLRGLARFAPAPRFALLVALVSPLWLLSGTLTGQVIATGAAACLVIAALVDALRIPGNRYISLRRDFPAMIGVGDTRNGSFSIESSWPATLRIAITQQLPGIVTTSALPAEPLPVHPHQTVTIPFDVSGRARGTLPLGPVALTITGPWQLMRRSLIYYLEDTISSTPSIAGAGRYRLLAAQQRLRTAGQRVIRQRGSGTSFSNLRDYVPGDDPRRIDWKATARRHRLISREFTVEQGQTIVLALDCGRMMTQLAGDRPRFEYALASALTLADTALSTGDRVGLIVFDSRIRRYIAPTRSPGTLGAIRDALTGVTATMTEPDYAAAFRTLTQRNRRRSLIVLFTDVIDVRSSRAVIALTSRSAERHLPLVVALRNEQLVATSIPSAGASAEQLYESVAAEELISARDEALGQMRQAGVEVLDTPPTAMTSALVNRYLEIKERSAL